MANFWCRRRVLVTGASGFIGSYVVADLLGRGAAITATCTARAKATRLAPLAQSIRIIEADLCEPADADRVCQGQEVVISLAHCDGSLTFKRSRPAYLFRRNMLITLNLLDAASLAGTARFLLTSSSEVYVSDAPAPLVENGLIADPSDRLSDGYVWSKRMSELATALFSHEYSLPVLIARPGNVYGPGDDFDAARGRVIPSFIYRSVANEPILIWGDGSQVRSFLYVEDLARGLVDFAERGSNGDIANFGGDEAAIAELAHMVTRLCDSSSEIRFDPSKPAGPAKRVLACDAARRICGFKPQVGLEEGLARTIESYRSSGLQVSATAG